MPLVVVYVVDLSTGSTFAEAMAQGDQVVDIKRRIMIRHGGYSIESIVLAKAGERLVDNETKLCELETRGELIVHFLVEYSRLFLAFFRSNL
jgi:hypothetical protein